MILWFFCFFQVPSYIYGIPLYDFKQCILYLVTALNKNGFEIKYTHPNLLYISWYGKTNKNSLNNGPFNIDVIDAPSNIEYIINPATNRKVQVDSFEGRYIIEKFYSN